MPHLARPAGTLSVRVTEPERAVPRSEPLLDQIRLPAAVPNVAVRRRPIHQDELGGSTRPADMVAVLRRHGSGQPLSRGLAEPIGAQVGVDRSVFRAHRVTEAAQNSGAAPPAADSSAKGLEVTFVAGTATAAADDLLAAPPADLLGALRRHAVRVEAAAADDLPAARPADLLGALRRPAESAPHDRSVVRRHTLAGDESGTRRRANSAPGRLGRPRDADHPGVGQGRRRKRARSIPARPTAAATTGDIGALTETSGLGPADNGSGDVTLGHEVDESGRTEVADEGTGGDDLPPGYSDLDGTGMDDGNGYAAMAAAATADIFVDPDDLVLRPLSEAGERILAFMYDGETGSAEAPSSANESRQRLGYMANVVRAMQPEQRAAIVADRPLLKRVKKHLGAGEYSTFLASLQVTRRGADRTGPARHLSGAQADTVIAERIKQLPHLVPYFTKAVANGRVGAGNVAVVSDDEWQAAYEAEYGAVTVAERQTEQNTNAFIAKASKDTPAIIHADRGARSTAIHESMHRYSPGEVGSRYRAFFNEGVTEYFTRLLTNRDGGPPGEGAERENYGTEVTFVRDILYLFGKSTKEQEVTLAEMYFANKADLLPEVFKAAWLEHQKKMAEEELTTRWERFFVDIRDGNLRFARAELPPR